MHIPQLFHREKRQRCIHHLVRCNIWNRQLNSIIILTMKGKINALSCIFLHFMQQLTELLFSSREALEEQLGLALDPETDAVEGVGIPFHAGAAAWYKQAGITVD